MIIYLFIFRDQFVFRSIYLCRSIHLHRPINLHVAGLASTGADAGSEALWDGSPDVEAQQQGDEDAGNDDVAESEHREVVGRQAVLQQVLWEDHCDRDGGRMTVSCYYEAS